MAATSFDAAAAAAALASNNNLLNPAANTSFVFDIYDDGAARPPTTGGHLVQQQQQQPPPPPSPLPGGPCNFVDLSHGSSGAQCGCRRFWSRTGSAAATPIAASFGAFSSVSNLDGSNAGLGASQAGWCMCSHHACFHDHAPGSGAGTDWVPANTSFFPTAAAPAGAATSFLGNSSPPPPILPSSVTLLGQENERPRSHRAPLSPVQDHQEGQLQEEDRNNHALPDLSFGFPSDVPAHLDASFAAMITDAAQESRDIMAAAEATAAEDEAAATDATSATPTPTPSASPSAAVSVAGPPADHSIPDTLSWGPYGMSSRGDVTASSAASFSASNTHPAPLPPSQQPPPSTTTTTSYTSQMRYMRPFAGKGLQTLTHAAAAPFPSGSPLKSFLEPSRDASAHRPLRIGSLTNAVQAHEVRLDKLENPSFIASSASVSASFTATQAHEECIERNDHMDLRVTELESRFDEVEKRLDNNDNDAATVTASSVVSTSTARAPLSTTTSIASLTSAPASLTDPAILSQLRTLQAHVCLLQQASLPSLARPWQLEVVFLPFPLKGVWVEAAQFVTTAAVAAAAAAQRRQAGATLALGAEGDDDEWTQIARRTETPRLLPRACAPDRTIYSRLRSRGLVQMLAVRGADARSLQVAMTAAFGPVLREMSSSITAPKHSDRPPSSSTSSQFLALQQPWVPLRKVHKDSRLRFLTRPEMLTPAVWDASFLMASVVMKASGGLHRLYVTQPDAYLQNDPAYAHGWSWQRLRQLPRVQMELGEDAFDDGNACWTWDSTLDEPPPTSTSVSSSSSSSSLVSSNRMHRPSPSPFSRGTTPMSHGRGPVAEVHRASHPPMMAMTATAATAAPVTTSARSHSVSIGASGSSDQFFTVAQSPMQQRLQQQQHLRQVVPGTTIPTASASLRRSLSPFFSSASPSAARRPLPPIRTTSMPVPPPGTSPIVTRGASSGAVSKRRVQTAGGYQATAAAGAPPLSAGVTKRSRPRSARSPSFGGFWPRNTPRYSRSPSATPGPGGQPMVLWTPAAAQQQQRQQGLQSVRGTTPFCYATPYSNAAGADHPPAPASSIGSGSGRRQRRQNYRQEHQQYVRRSRHGSRGPIAATMGHGNDGQHYYDDEDMMMVGYGSDDVDDFDYPMTQDGDDDDDDEHDDDDDIEVYEDGQDMLGLGHYRQQQQLYHQQEQGQQQHKLLLPEDEPRPGIEADDDDDGGDYISHTFGGQNHGTQDTHDDDEDESMSDSENMNPLSLSLFDDDQVDEDGQQHQQQHQQHQQQQEDERSDRSSQPSEYPSTRRTWRLSGGVVVYKNNTSHGDHNEDDHGRGVEHADIGFKIHEDGDASNL